jgi:hypothetical protein
MANSIPAERLPNNRITGIPESKVRPLLVGRVTILGASQGPHLKLLLTTAMPVDCGDK